MGRHMIFSKVSLPVGFLRLWDPRSTSLLPRGILIGWGVFAPVAAIAYIHVHTDHVKCALVAKGRI